MSRGVEVVIVKEMGLPLKRVREERKVKQAVRSAYCELWPSKPFGV